MATAPGALRPRRSSGERDAGARDIPGAAGAGASRAGASRRMREDDITEMLKDYEDQVKKVRTGGLIGSGAKGHREAREAYLKLRGLKA